jgi:hypothetical protein
MLFVIASMMALMTPVICQTTCSKSGLQTWLLHGLWTGTVANSSSFGYTVGSTHTFNFLVTVFAMSSEPSRATRRYFRACLVPSLHCRRSAVEWRVSTSVCLFLRGRHPRKCTSRCRRHLTTKFGPVFGSSRRTNRRFVLFVPASATTTGKFLRFSVGQCIRSFPIVRKARSRQRVAFRSCCPARFPTDVAIVFIKNPLESNNQSQCQMSMLCCLRNCGIICRLNRQRKCRQVRIARIKILWVCQIDIRWTHG